MAYNLNINTIITREQSLYHHMVIDYDTLEFWKRLVFLIPEASVL